MQTYSLNIKNFTEKLTKFIYSPYFVWLIGLIIFVSWLSPQWMIGLIIISVIAGLILAFYKDTLPVLSILWMFVFIIGTNRHQLKGFAPLLFCIIPIIVGLIVNIIRYKPNFSFLKFNKIKAFSIGIIISSLAIILGGIHRTDRSVLPVLAIIGLGIVLALCYMFFNATIEKTEDSSRMLQYISVIMYVSAVVISLQLITFYGRLGNIDDILYATRFKMVDIGWAGNNNYSIMLGLCLPSVLYYAIKSKKIAFLHIIFSVIIVAFIYLSMCRGAMLVLTALLPLLLGYTLIKGTKKAQILLSLTLFFDILVVVFLYFAPDLLSIFGERTNLGFDDSGRFELYNDALNLFKQSPIFGWGFDYRLGEFAGDSYTPYWYHSTVFQAMASMGIVGLLALIILEITRYRTFLTNRSMLKLAVMVGLLIYDLYSLIDVCFYAPNTYIIFMIMTLAAEKDLKEDEGKPILLPLIVKKYKQIKNKIIDKKQKEK